jgi:hypothetical protein
MEKASSFVSFKLFRQSEQVISAGYSIGISVAKTYFEEFAFLQIGGMSLCSVGR